MGGWARPVEGVAAVGGRLGACSHAVMQRLRADGQYPPRATSTLPCAPPPRPTGPSSHNTVITIIRRTRPPPSVLPPCACLRDACGVALMLPQGRVGRCGMALSRAARAAGPAGQRRGGVAGLAAPAHMEGALMHSSPLPGLLDNLCACLLAWGRALFPGVACMIRALMKDLPCNALRPVALAPVTSWSRKTLMVSACVRASRPQAQCPCRRMHTIGKMQDGMAI